MVNRSSLIWSPTYEYLVDRIGHHKQLRILISPFIKLDALEKLLDPCEDKSALSIITRWSARDIVSGVSDISIYPLLKDLGVSLYIHPRIHLKLLVFNDALAFHTSGNITRRGLGLTARHNVEIGCQVEINYDDWGRIYGLLAKSTCVDDTVYDTACNYLKENESKSTPLPRLKLLAETDKRFSRLSLPSSPTPEDLFRFYRDPRGVTDDESDTAVYMHDLALYQIPQGLGRDAFFPTLGQRFKGHAFIEAIVKLIKQAGTARFGLVNEWITNNCSDKPMPYRWELKENTRSLYNWLDFFYDEISWDVPGTHSMVIRWAAEQSND